MIHKLLYIILLCWLCSCQSVHAIKPVQPPFHPQGTPMSCKVEGEIVSIPDTPDPDSTSPCARYHCQAFIKITSVTGCGSAVSEPLKVGDTSLVTFAFTLTDTKKAFPIMKAHYPGLVKGDKFIANAQERLAPGSGATWTVFDYAIRQ